MAILGYFAISSQPIPQEKVTRYTRFYFLSGIFSTVSNLAYMAGPAFWWLFFFFPVDTALDQAREDFLGPVLGAKFGRLTGLTFACQAAVFYMFARYGVAEIFNPRRWWRLVFFMACVGLSTLGGFRSSVVIIGLLFALQFLFEGLFRTRLLFVFLLLGVMGTAVLVPFADKLPLSVQRSISFLPIEIDPAAAANAAATIEWRTEMWSILLQQVPRYFWIGKGYALDPTDMYLTQQSVLRGLAKDNEFSVVAGDYHSGPLSTIIPLGIFGVIGLLWFWLGALRWLYRLYRHGPEYLNKINTFLLSFFLTRIIFFIFGFGSFWSDLPMFTGIIAFSIALNGTQRIENQLNENANSSAESEPESARS
jgi:hypothetical protein